MRNACAQRLVGYNTGVQQIVNHYPRLAMEVVLSVLAERAPIMRESGDFVDVWFDAGHITRLLDAASSEEGSSGVEAPWADEACWRVYEVLKSQGVSWMDACGEAAEAASYLDRVANEGLDGCVRFLQEVKGLYGSDGEQICYV